MCHKLNITEVSDRMQRKERCQGVKVFSSIIYPFVGMRYHESETPNLINIALVRAAKFDYAVIPIINLTWPGNWECQVDGVSHSPRGRGPPTYRYSTLHATNAVDAVHAMLETCM